MEGFGNKFGNNPPMHDLERGPEKGMENSKERAPRDGRFNEDEAFLAQKLATEHEGVKFSEQTEEKSMDFARELIEELRASDISLDGLDWELVRAASGPAEVIGLLKDYAESRGVDMRMIDEYLMDTKDQPKDFSYVKKFAVIVSLVLAFVTGGVPSESVAAPLTGQQSVREYSPSEMNQIVEGEMYRSEYGANGVSIHKFQEDYKSYFNELKAKYPEIKDIQLSHILLSQKVIEKTYKDKILADEHGEFQKIIPAVVADVEIKISKKNGEELVLHDKSYQDINSGTTADSVTPSHVALDYLVKKGWISANNVMTSFVWRKNLIDKLDDRLIYESVHRVGSNLGEKLGN